MTKRHVMQALLAVVGSLILVFPLVLFSSIPKKVAVVTFAFWVFVLLISNRAWAVRLFLIGLICAALQLCCSFYSSTPFNLYLFVSVLTTSWHEAYSFTDTLSWKQISQVFGYLAAGGMCIYLYRLTTRQHVVLSRLSQVGILFFVIAQAYLMPIITLKNMVSSILLVYKKAEFEPINVVAAKQPVAETIVLVIGESATKLRFSLYGYEKPTNAHLSARNDIFVYEDVLATGSYTQPNVKTILGGEVLEAQQTPPFDLISVARAAGYTVVYIDNNKFVQPDPLYFMAKKSNTYINTNGGGETSRVFDNIVKLDAVITPHYKKALDEHQGRLLVILHMTGSHFAQSFRYPESHRLFDSHYDNTIVYTDALLNEWINLLDEKRPEQPAFFLYISDHGSDVPPGCHYGAIPSPEYAAYSISDNVYSSIAVPLLVWSSPHLLGEHPNVRSALGANQPTKMDNRVVLPTLLSLMGVMRVNGQETSSYSLLNPDFHFSPRLNTAGLDMDEAIASEEICVYTR